MRQGVIRTGTVPLMLSRRTLLGTAATTTAVGLTSASAAPSVAHLPVEPGAADTFPVATFVSAPDFFNGDVGDLRVLPSYDGGPNSINDSWVAAIDACLSEVAAHQPDAVFVAGDLVEGHWNIDDTHRELFGKVNQRRDRRSLAACERAIHRAGDLYYGYYQDMFASRGLALYPALGDHEILDDRQAPDLDDRWSPSGTQVGGKDQGRRDNRYYLVPAAKNAWGRHFTQTRGGRPRFADRPVGPEFGRTAYAVDIGPMLTLITVDVFDHHRDGVRLGVFGAQLTWLRRTIRAAKRAGRVVIVQGHIPIVRPVRYLASGLLHVPTGTDSAFYAALEDEGADFYFCGEVHDTTVQQRSSRSVVQVSHGCVFRYAFNYLVGTVYSDGTTAIDYYEIPIESASAEEGLWQTDSSKAMRTELNYGEPALLGQLITRERRILARTDKLGAYQPDDDPWKYRGNLDPVLY
jgi:hypothetical protein